MTRAIPLIADSSAAAWRGQYRDATIDCQVFRDVGLVIVEGTVDAETWTGILEDLAAWVAAQRLDSVATDCERVDFGVDAEALAAADMAVCASGGVPSVPMGFVVAAERNRMFLDYMLLVSRHGCCRAPRPTKPEALAWAREQAKVHRYFKAEERLYAARNDGAFQAMLQGLVAKKRRGRPKQEDRSA